MVTTITIALCFMGACILLGFIIGIFIICLRVCWAIIRWIWLMRYRISGKTQREQASREIKAQELAESNERYHERVQNLDKSLGLSHER